MSATRSPEAGDRRPRGELLVLSAPSGTGKTTIIHEMLRQLGDEAEIDFSVSHTTRPQRRGERDGHDYHFVDEASFHGMIERGEFLEWATVHGNLYGTSLGEIEPRLEAGRDVLVDIDVQGAEQVLERMPEACSIFVVPPSYRELERRLIDRGLDDGDTIRRRLSVSRWEIERYSRYDYVIITRRVDRASRALAAIIQARRQRRQRLAWQVDGILAGFPISGSE